VLEAAAQLGFAPSRVARGLRMQSTRIIGAVVADIPNPFFVELVRRVGSAGQELGYCVLLIHAPPSQELEPPANQGRFMSTPNSDVVYSLLSLAFFKRTLKNVF
jgi:DNA-binding LacI/PurR family transcriptional regulator